MVKAMVNHRSEWTYEDDTKLHEHVIECVSKGKTQMDAFKELSDVLGRTVGAIEFRWKQIRKGNHHIMEDFQWAISVALVDTLNDPQPETETVEDATLKQVTKGAVRLDRMIKHIISPGDGIKLPGNVADELFHIEGTSSREDAYDRVFLEGQKYKAILKWIDESPINSRNYYRAIEDGYEKEFDKHEKISMIYNTLDKIKPNEPGYMMARAMIVMMWNTIEILDQNPRELFGMPLPF